MATVIERVINSIPQLCSDGMGVGNIRGKLTKEEHDEQFNKSRAELFHSQGEIKKVMKWLSAIDKSKTISYGCGSSYYLKHLAEDYEEVGYVTNGVFITACICAGFKYKVEDTVCYFNMAKKSVDKVKRGIHVS